MSQKNNFIAKIVGVAFMFTFLLSAKPCLTFASDLSIVPVTAEATLDKMIIVDVILSNNTQSVNAVSGSINFPKDILSVSSISKDGSIIKLWAEEPGFSNKEGILTFEGVILNPGFSSAKGKILQITFAPKKIGPVSLAFNIGSVLANDGLATNILKKMGTLDFTIKEGVVNLNKIITPNTSLPKPKLDPIEKPTILSYTEMVNDTAMIKVRGKTYPDSTIDFEFTNTDKRVFTDFAKSDTEGNFIFIASKPLPKGAYLFTARTTNTLGAQSVKTDPFPFFVEEPVISTVGIVSVPHEYAKEVVWTLFALLLIVFFYFYRHFFVLKLHIRKDLYKTLTEVKSDFDRVGREVKRQIENLESVKIKRELTKEELLLLKSFNTHLASIEKNLARNLEALGRDVE